MLIKENKMIPRLIHYCWFGHGELPEKAKACIESWKKHMPNCEIVEWNEENFDVNMNDFTKKAYELKKYAFVSDVARLYALYEKGGYYFDTDVEVFKPLDEFLNEPAFTGFEQPNYPVCATMGAEKGNPLIKEMLDYYNGKEFDTTTNTVILSNILETKGIDREKNEIQRIKNITIYPKEYFNDKGGYTYHWMNGSWL